MHVINDRRVVETIFSAETIAARIDTLAHEIADAGLKDLVVVAILKGSYVFAADLLRAFHRAGLSPEVDFLTLQSYHDDTVSSGKVEVLRDIGRGVSGRDVLIIDDILESGRTLAFAKSHLTERGAKSVHTCVLLDKPVPRANDVGADFRAFACPDVFVIGYGMDLANRFRELPFVGQLIEKD